MGTRRGIPVSLGGVMLVMMWLAGCGSTPDPGSGVSAAAGPVATPRLVIPKSVGGSPGTGPVVISSPAPLPGGKVGSQKIDLKDRTLIINSVTTQPTANRSSILIDLGLVVRNTSEKPIQNESSFFVLIGPEGDTFSQLGNSSDDFYRTIAAHASRGGTIEFKIPTATTSGIYLLYRPETATETVLTRLKMG